MNWSAGAEGLSILARASSVLEPLDPGAECQGGAEETRTDHEESVDFLHLYFLSFEIGAHACLRRVARPAFRAGPSPTIS